MNDGIRRRIERETGCTGLVEALTELAPGDLQSLLLQVYARRAAAVEPRVLLERYRESRFTPPASVDPRLLGRVVTLAFSLLEEPFQPLELSPVAPLGACSALGPVHQNKVLTTTRNLEVCADPSNSLALECAVRRREGRVAHLAASQRVVRAQALPPGPFYAHFRIFALASAAPYSRDFELEALRAHWAFYRKLLGELGLPVRIVATDLTSGRLEKALRGEVDFDSSRQAGYYRNCCFKIWTGDSEVGDGGFTDWTARLLSDAGEGLLTSGLGLDRLAAAC